MSIGSEKEQRNVVKRLLAESGGEAARAVLSAVSKVPVSVANMQEPGRMSGGGTGRPEDEIRCG
jgi:hypothetical protein